MSGLQGSSSSKPWVLLDSGELVLDKSPPRRRLGDKRAGEFAGPSSRPAPVVLLFRADGLTLAEVTAPRLMLFGSPSDMRPEPRPAPFFGALSDMRRAAPRTPFSDTQNSPPRAGPSTRAVGPIRTSTTIRTNRTHQISRMSTGARPPGCGAPRRRASAVVDGFRLVGGSRADRRRNLTEGDLFLGNDRPPPISNPQEHYICSVCRSLKSHPVSVSCGHSFCYACLRLWLEKSWSCPNCRTFVTAPPFRHTGEEASIQFEHPCWADESRVTYSWEGLEFPRVEKVILRPSP
ncbi:hypothetical protein B0H16DRAFT_1744527 [Mycena metata]|uniref:RING-type domain-containing protein n=1 Tax=Mycena metata TaxID=1033252 RepID=A0AAD7H4F6_9AGAR|nr:hypothetical protein B0H16DRAFT_1744527 [Mycena metata]